jgi:uncharacterized protein YceH (UPF0502 family)
VELTAEQGRVLGALVEKERTTPQGYPLTDNALLAACNQTTSRDPVVSYDVATVRMAVRALREQGLLRTVHRTGERSDKHRHELEHALGLSPAQAALLAVLLLRGAQTLAELRSRCERMHPFASVDEVERELLAMAERDEPLVTLLPRQRASLRPGVPSPADTLGAVLARTEQAPDALLPVVQQVEGGTVPSSLEARVEQLADEVAALRREVDDLRTALERATGG